MFSFFLAIPLLIFTIPLSVLAQAQIPIVPGYQAAAISARYTQAAKIYWQQYDTSIIEYIPASAAATGNGSFVNSSNKTVIPAGVAVPGTPLAAISLDGLLEFVNLYFIGVGLDGTSLQELAYNGSWYNGSMSGLGYQVEPSNRLLYAIANGTGPYWRVGFPCYQGQLCEAANYFGWWQFWYYSPWPF